MKFFAILALAMSFNAFTQDTGYSDAYEDGYANGYDAGYENLMEYHFGSTLSGQPCNLGLELSPENPDLYRVSVTTPRIVAATARFTGKLAENRIAARSILIQGRNNEKVTTTNNIKVVLAPNGEPAGFTVQRTIKKERKVWKIFNVENSETSPKVYCAIGV